MTSISAVQTAPGAPGVGPPDTVARPDTPTMLAELEVFEKLMMLSEDVSAGRHPRLRLPSQVVRTEAKAPLIHSHPGTSAATAPSLTAAAQQSQVLPSNSAPAPPSAQPTPTAVAASDFDPIFLTKSEHLKRAEKRLERKRVERALEEQLQRRKLADQREYEQQDALPEFDVADVLQRAQELVKPLSASEVNAANVNGSASDSIDNNTFYSSQANDSETDDRADLRASKPCKYYFVEGRCLKGDHCDWSHDPAFKRKMQDPQAVDINTHGVDSDVQPRVRPHRLFDQAANQQGAGDIAMEDGEIHESSYSPPRTRPLPLADAELQHATQPGSHQRNSGPQLYVNDQPAPTSAGRRPSGRESPMNGEGRVVRNHITSPVAPQPARVSPLAIAKMTRVERVRQAGDERTPRSQHFENLGPSSGPDNITVAKKRRRGASPNEESRNVAPRHRAASPQPVIKAEPLSPVPLTQHPIRTYQEVEEVSSPVMYRAQPPARRVIYQDARPPVYERVYADSGEVYRVATPSSRRVVSGPVTEYMYDHRSMEPRRIISSSRPPAHVYGSHETYVERVPSAAGTRHVEYAHPVEYYPAQAPPPHLRRPVSRATVIELDAPPPPAYRASVQPQPTYVRAAREPSPGPHYAVAERGVRPMPPPVAPTQPRRIVLDQHGNRYYEAPLTPAPVRRASLAPEPTGYAQHEPFVPPPPPPARTATAATAASPLVGYRPLQPPPPPPSAAAHPTPSAPPLVTQRAASRAVSHAPPPTTFVYERGADGDYRPRPVSPGSAGGHARWALPARVESGSDQVEVYERPRVRMPPPPPQPVLVQRPDAMAPRSVRGSLVHADKGSYYVPVAESDVYAPVERRYESRGYEYDGRYE